MGLYSKTWHYEATALAAILAVTVLVTGNAPVEWVGALGVWISSRRLSIANRMQEAEQDRVDAGAAPLTECYPWQVRYLYAGELTWTVYFIWLGAYSALVGVAWMALYPQWRRVYRRYRPRGRGLPTARMVGDTGPTDSAQ